MTLKLVCVTLLLCCHWFCRMLTPISRLECLTPGYLPSTQRESSSRRRLKATSPRKCATQHGYKHLFHLFYKKKTLVILSGVIKDTVADISVQWEWMGWKQHIDCMCVCVCFAGTATSVSWWNISSPCSLSGAARPLLWTVLSTAVSLTGRSLCQNWTWMHYCRHTYKHTHTHTQAHTL